MAKEIVLYNPLSGSSTPEHLSKIASSSAEFFDITKIADYAEFFAGISTEDTVILCGGDGTLNRFVNLTEGLTIENEILYFPSGTGNDFAFDVTGQNTTDAPFSVKEYLKDLPTVEVKGKTYRFLNGVGYGIDGYCCQVGDELRATSHKPINYTAIAIKGLLFHYKPASAKVTVDGVEHTYKKVWLAPTMHGKYYGGGMIPTPGQVRNNADGTISVLVYHNSGKLRALMVFPSIFKGEHVKHPSMCVTHSGHEISVEFDRPVALQIDGETILDVRGYRAVSALRKTEKTPVTATEV